MKDLALQIYPTDDKSTALQSSRNIFRDMNFNRPTYTGANLQTKDGVAYGFIPNH